MKGLGNSKVTRTALTGKIQSRHEKETNWVIESFGIKAEDVNNPEKLPLRGDDTMKNVYVCYDSFEPGQEKKPTLYIRKLIHN